MYNELITRTPKDIKNNFKEIRNLCKKEPVSIVADGKEDMVIMSYDNYISMMTDFEKEAYHMLCDKLAQAEDDFKNGRVYSSEQVFDEVINNIKNKKL